MIPSEPEKLSLKTLLICILAELQELNENRDLLELTVDLLIDIREKLPCTMTNKD